MKTTTPSDRDSPVPSEPAPGPFVTGRKVDRRGAATYVHLIRAPTDPERSPRPKGGVRDRAPHRTLSKQPAQFWEPEILAALADGIPRTFNRIGVERFDLTADVLFTTSVNKALWSLVERGFLEHTLTAPILFRIRKGSPAPPKVPEQLHLFGAP